MAQKRRRSANRWLVITQIILLTTALVMILFFRDLIATGASSVVGAFGDNDIQVQAPEKPSTKTHEPKATKKHAADKPTGNKPADDAREPAE